MDANNHSVNAKQSRGVVSAIVPAALLVAGVFGYSHGAQAACTVKNVTSIPLIFNVTETYSGNERPVGSTLYRASYQTGPFGGAEVTCDQDTTMYKFLTVTTEPAGPPTVMKTDFGTGPVYPTGVPGIGAVYFYSTPAAFISKTTPSYPQQIDFKANVPATQITELTAGEGNFDVALVKTGPVASGAAVSISQLMPHIALVLSPTQNDNPAQLKIVDFPQSGWITITTASCQTPDVTVNMGTYETNKFTAKGYTTPWKDASIVMQNCPKFSGYYANHYTGQTIPLEGGDAQEPSAGRNPNLLTVSLTTSNPVKDNLIIGLDSGTDTATGVGIELGYSNDINASPTTPANTWAPGKKWDISPPNDGRNSFKIPIAARYYQIENKATAGKANASVTFNIEYR
ncbi:type 1 fimbrial protein [Enterobacteriaceae bacterium H16N7]|nr:type 1 fimbrial protein [Dryocola clanedunensis]